MIGREARTLGRADAASHVFNDSVPNLLFRIYGFLQGHSFVIASANNIAEGICRFPGT